jgi:hypothetical protein
MRFTASLLGGKRARRSGDLRTACTAKIRADRADRAVGTRSVETLTFVIARFPMIRKDGLTYDDDDGQIGAKTAEFDPTQIAHCPWTLRSGQEEARTP